MREDIPLHDGARDRSTGKSECLALVWDEDEDEVTKPPGFESLTFTGQSDAIASYIYFSEGHSHHGKLKEGTF